MKTFGRIATALVVTLSLASAAAAQSSLTSVVGAAKDSAALADGKGSLTGVLTKKLGVTEDQASGGVGSLMTLAKEKLSGGDFKKVSKAVPDTDKYMQKAKDLGAVTDGKVGDKKGLDAAYGKLGMNPETGSKLTGVVVDFAGKLGGKKVQSLLSGLVK
jgi:hypothetical protein